MSRMREVLSKSETPGWDKAMPEDALGGHVHPDVRPTFVACSESPRLPAEGQDGIAMPDAPTSTSGTAAYWASLALSAARALPQAPRAKEPSPWGRRSANALGAPKSNVVPRPNPTPIFPAAATFVAAPMKPTIRPETEIKVSPDVSSQKLAESHHHHSGFSRAIRKLRRWVGLSVGRIPARCSGNARSGMPCRGPAMDNGFCRMHGGKREQSLVERLG